MVDIFFIARIAPYCDSLTWTSQNQKGFLNSFAKITRKSEIRI